MVRTDSEIHEDENEFLLKAQAKSDAREMLREHFLQQRRRKSRTGRCKQHILKEI